MLDHSPTLISENRTEYLKTLFNDASLGFFIVNTNGELEYFNDEAADIIGLESRDGISRHSLYDIESVLNCGLGDSIPAILAGSTFRKNEHRCTNWQGRFVVLNLFCSPYRRDDNEISGVIGIIQNITESHQRKSDLEEALYELSIMWQISEALSSTFDLDEILKIILTGVTANQGLGFNRAFLFLVDESGEELEGTMAVGPGSPEEAGLIWSRLSQQPRTLTELLNGYIEHESVASVTLTSLIKNWKISLKENASIFSQSINESRGLNVLSSDSLSNESIEILRRIKTDNIAVAPIISKGKKLGLIAADNQITGRPITDSEVQLLQTFANHTAVALERSQLYEGIIEHAASLEEKNRLIAESQEQIVRIEKMSIIGELTSSIAHELRNPLTIIGGFANLMLNSGNNEVNNEYLNIVLSEAKRAESVLNQVLDFSRASHTESGEININQLIKTTFELFLSRSKHSQRSPVFKEADEKIAVWGNRDQLQHAVYQFMNLTVEEMTDDCKAIISIRRDDDWVRMIIEFDGGDSAQKTVKRTLSQIFDTSMGTQKLSIIVAGETIKYHGGSYGISLETDKLPSLYLELPLKRDINDG